MLNLRILKGIKEMSKEIVVKDILSYLNIFFNKELKEDILQISSKNLVAWVEETDKSIKVGGKYYFEYFETEVHYLIENLIAVVLRAREIKYNKVSAIEGIIFIDNIKLCTYKVLKDGTLILNKATI